MSSLTAFERQTALKPLGFDPAKLNGLSKRLIVGDAKEKYPLKPGDLDPVDLRDERFPHLIIA